MDYVALKKISRQLARVAGYALCWIPIAFLVYALYMYFQRSKALKEGEGQPRAAFSSDEHKSKKAVVKGQTVEVDGQTFVVDWIGEDFTDGPKTIKSVKDKIGGKVSLSDGTVFENPPRSTFQQDGPWLDLKGPGILVAVLCIVMAGTFFVSIIGTKEEGEVVSVADIAETIQ